jgi:hypothetical protein
VCPRTYSAKEVKAARRRKIKLILLPTGCYDLIFILEQPQSTRTGNEMSSNGMVGTVQLGGSTPGKLPIQPTPEHFRKPPTKPKQRKSRTGCMTCKAKRLKCDEKKVLSDDSDKEEID